MVDLKKLTDRAKDLADENRARLEDLAEKGVAKYEETTGKEAPSQVTDAVDKIDPDDDEHDVQRTRPQASGSGDARPATAPSPTHGR